jgi:chloride channel 3/4/5
VADRSVPTLRADKNHTVRSLTGRLLELARGGMADTGFPILVREAEARGLGHGHGHGKDREGDRGNGGGGMRVIGFLGTNELEHALGE